MSFLGDEVDTFLFRCSSSMAKGSQHHNTFRYDDLQISEVVHSSYSFETCSLESMPAVLYDLCFCISEVINCSEMTFHRLQALSKALTEDELLYLRTQFELLEPRDGCVSLNNFKTVSDSFSFFMFHIQFHSFHLLIFG